MIAPVGLKNLLEVMSMMAETERLIADLYRTCADIWEEDREFWLATVAEEKKHAKNIEKMAQIIVAKPEQFEMGRPFNQVAIRTIKTGLEGQLERLKKGQFTRERMLFVARDIEASVIEKSYAEIVRTNDVGYQALVNEIVQDTTKHKNSIEQRIQELKAGG